VVGGGRSGLDPIAIILKELRVLGSFTYADEFAEIIALLGANSVLPRSPARAAAVSPSRLRYASKANQDPMTTLRPLRSLPESLDRRFKESA
jgi:hypothetical protein